MTNSRFLGGNSRIAIHTLLLFLLASQLIGIAIANASPKELTRAEKRLAAFNDSFEATGESNNCINTRRIRETSIIDKEHILFKLSHGEYAVNKLPRTCHSLRRGKTFAYAPIAQQLCSVDTITVLDDNLPMGFRLVGPRCGLGQFSMVKKKVNIN